MQIFQIVLVEGWRNALRNWRVILPLYLTSLLLGLVQIWPLLANAMIQSTSTAKVTAIPDVARVDRQFRDVSPMRTPITIEDIGDTALYLCSGLSRAVTGEVVYVDGGYNVIGVPDVVPE